jgi:hypothetical protein
MRVVSYFTFLIATGAFVITLNSSLAYAKTVEAGESNSSWNGRGEVQDLVDGEQVINGTLKGVLIARHKAEGKMTVHSSRLACPVRVNLNKKKDDQAIEGLCTIVAHEGKDVAYAHWKCVGNSKECEGEFTFTGGVGGFNGISGTTPFLTSIVFELQEGKHAQAIGYAV